MSAPQRLLKSARALVARNLERQDPPAHTQPTRKPQPCICAQVGRHPSQPLPRQARQQHAPQAGSTGSTGSTHLDLAHELERAGHPLAADAAVAEALEGEVVGAARRGAVYLQGNNAVATGPGVGVAAGALSGTPWKGKWAGRQQKSNMFSPRNKPTCTLPVSMASETYIAPFAPNPAFPHPQLS